MEVLRRHQFREVKSAQSAELFERVLACVGAHAAERARFVLEDIHSGASAISRAVKNFPELHRYALPEFESGGSTRRKLSNVVAHHHEDKLVGHVTTEILRAIARGFPRTYPFFDSDIFFTRGLPWLSANSVEPELRPVEDWDLFGEALPCVCFKAHYTPSGYRAFVHATVSLGDSATFGATLPQLPDLARDALAPFGKSRNQLMIKRTPQEESELSRTTEYLRALHSIWSKRSNEEMARLALPHALPAEGTGAQYSPMTLPHKHVLVDAFKPRGYRYSPSHSGHGCFAFTKPTTNGNRIELSCEVGRHSRRYTGGMLVSGLNGHCYAPIPAHPKQPYPSYDVGSDETWGQLVENVALLADRLEQVFVPDVDVALGRTPSWYEW